MFYIPIHNNSYVFLKICLYLDQEVLLQPGKWVKKFFILKNTFFIKLVREVFKNSADTFNTSVSFVK